MWCFLHSERVGTRRNLYLRRLSCRLRRCLVRLLRNLRILRQVLPTVHRTFFILYSHSRSPTGFSSTSPSYNPSYTTIFEYNIKLTESISKPNESIILTDIITRRFITSVLPKLRTIPSSNKSILLPKHLSTLSKHGKPHIPILQCLRVNKSKPRIQSNVPNLFTNVPSLPLK